MSNGYRWLQVAVNLERGLAMTKSETNWLIISGSPIVVTVVFCRDNNHGSNTNLAPPWLSRSMRRLSLEGVMQPAVQMVTTSSCSNGCQGQAGRFTKGYTFEEGLPLKVYHLGRVYHVGEGLYNKETIPCHVSDTVPIPLAMNSQFQQPQSSQSMEGARTKACQTTRQTESQWVRSNGK